MTPADAALLWDELDTAERDHDLPRARRLWLLLRESIPQPREPVDPPLDASG